MSKGKKEKQSEQKRQKSIQKAWWQSVPVHLLLIAFLTAVSYWPTFSNGWTNWDDNGYVLDNELVKHTNLNNWTEHFKQSSVMGNYHPIAMLSLAIDYNLYNKDATGFHRTSLFIHLLNTILLYFILLQLFKHSLLSLTGALLFSIHPMHVESVAWVAERKDVLYVFFYFSSVLTFFKYNAATSNKWLWYSITLILFVLSNLSKAQAVTLPVVLILIDYWQGNKDLKKNITDKIPFLALALFFGLLAIKAQQESEAINFIPFYTWSDRLLFASYALFSYIYKFLLPVQLSAFHPYPLKTSDVYPILYYLAPVSLLILFAGSAWFLRYKKWYWCGMGIFMVNIALILQLLPVGNAIFAERYTYMAYTGMIIIFIAVVKLFIETKASLSKPLTVAISLLLLIFSYQTYSRVTVWNNSETLWTDVISKYNYAPNAHNNLGSYYQKKEMLDSAFAHFNIALSLQPDFPEALINRSDIYRVRGLLDSAVVDCNRAIALRPNDEGGYMNRGIAYSIQGRYDEALEDFNKVLSMNDNNIKAHSNRANLLALRNDFEGSLKDYARVIELDPSYTEAYANRARTYVTMKRYQDALKDIQYALQLRPDYADAYLVSADVNYNLGNYQAALEAATRAQSLGKPINEAFVNQVKLMMNGK
jgi:tetratricopeptide (TPR) repeat protein